MTEENFTSKRSHRFIDLTGQTFGKLKVIAFHGLNKYGKSQWLCRCVEGNETIVRGNSLASRNTKSCGCWKRERPLVHGHAKNRKVTPEYQAFVDARSRCSNGKHREFRDYGGRGIEFHFNNFADFIAHIGLKPSPKHSLDRIDNNGHYESGNVKWSTQKEQLRNRRTSEQVAHDRSL